MIPVTVRAFQEIFRVQAQGLVMIIFLCLFSLWAGSLLLSMAKGSQRLTVSLISVLVILWHLSWAMTIVGPGIEAQTALAGMRMYLYHLAFTFWFLMCVQETLSTQRFQTLFVMLLIFDALVLLLFLFSGSLDFDLFTGGGLNFQIGLTQFLLFINIGKLFAGVLAMLTTWRFRRLSIQVGIIFLELIVCVFIIARLNSATPIVQQISGTGIWFSLLLLIEISFRTGPIVHNTSALQVFERMERIAILLNPLGKESYYSGGASKRKHLTENLSIDEVRSALGKDWQQLDLRPSGSVYQWQSFDLHGGYLLYFEDIQDRLLALTRHNQLLEELQKKKNLLLQRGAMNRELEQFQMRLNILQRVENSISHSLRELAERIRELDEDNISMSQVDQIRILCAYIRRRSNLAVAELQENKLDAVAVRAWCEEILQLGKSKIHLEIASGYVFNYENAGSLQDICLTLALLCASQELWVYGVLRKGGRLSVTLSGFRSASERQQWVDEAPMSWRIEMDEEELEVDIRLGGHHA